MIDDQLKHDRDDFNHHQQQTDNTARQLTINQTTHSDSPTETSASSIRNALTHSQGFLLKRKYPNTPPRHLVNRPSSSRVLRSAHIRYTNTFEFFFPLSPLYPDYITTEPESQRDSYVDENSILPTVSCLLFHNFTNPFKIPIGKAEEDELYTNILHQLTNALHFIDFDNNAHSHVVNRFIARNFDHFPINHYDHAFIRYMDDLPFETDSTFNSQLTDKNLLKNRLSV